MRLYLSRALAVLRTLSQIEFCLFANVHDAIFLLIILHIIFRRGEFPFNKAQSLVNKGSRVAGHELLVHNGIQIVVFNLLIDKVDSTPRHIRDCGYGNDIGLFVHSSRRDFLLVVVDTRQHGQGLDAEALTFLQRSVAREVYLPHASLYGL